MATQLVRGGGRRPLPKDAGARIRRRIRSLIGPDCIFSSQSHAASVLNADVRTVAKWCDVKRGSTPDLSWLLDISRETGLSLDWLVLGTEPRFVGAGPSGADLPSVLASFVATQLTVRLGLDGEANESENRESGRTPEIAADGERLLERIVESAKAEFEEFAEAWRAVRAQREATLRAVAVLSAFQSSVASKIPAVGPAWPRDIEREIALAKASILEAMPQPDLRRPAVWFASSMQGADAWERYLFPKHTRTAVLTRTPQRLEELLGEIPDAVADVPRG